MKYTVHVGDQVRELELVAGAAAGSYTVTLAGRPLPVTARQNPDGSLLVSIDGQPFDAFVVRQRGAADATVCLAGQSLAVACNTGMEEQLAKAAIGAGAAHEAHVRTSMPGKVVDVKVGPGDVVAAGQRLLVLEAMKMENEIVAKGPARVKVVHVKKGQAVDSGALLMELEKVEGQ